MPDDGFEVVADNYIEAFAEKFRGLAGRTRPRDFYDVVNLYRKHRCPEGAVRRSLMSCAKTARSKTSRFPGSDLQLHRVDVEAGRDHFGPKAMATSVLGLPLRNRLRREASEIP
jgi:hypothetical protein